MSVLLAIRFVIGLLLLTGGAELLVRGAARLAAAWGVSSLVIGLTVVAFGTSAPEMAVSLLASLAGSAEIAIGNVVGSNIFNVLFILGVSALIAPLAVSSQLVRLDVPIMIIASIVLWFMAANGEIGIIESGFLLAGVIAYTTFLIRTSRAQRAAREGALPPPDPVDPLAPLIQTRRPLLDLVLVLGGLAMLVLGSRWLVDGAVVLARAIGVSELVIGLTVIAAGTSLPELATSVLATMRGQRDIAVGNVVGSNIFNIMAILGVAGLAGGGTYVAPAAITFDIPVMTVVAITCLPIFFTEHSISRWEGGLFLGYYIAYTLYLVLAATGHQALPVFSRIMLLFVLPITAVMLLLFAWRSGHHRSA